MSNKQNDILDELWAEAMTENDKLISGLEIAEAPIRLILLRLKFELLDSTNYTKLKRGIETIVKGLERELDKGIKL